MDTKIEQLVQKVTLLKEFRDEDLMKGSREGVIACDNKINGILVASEITLSPEDYSELMCQLGMEPVTCDEWMFGDGR